MNLPDTHEPASSEGARRDGTLAHFDGNPETTLRMVALVPPPEGLEERIQARLRAQMRAGLQVELPKARVLAWPSNANSGAIRFESAAWRTAAAAAIVAVVVGGGWGIASRVLPATSARGVVAPVRAVGPGGFSSAGAMRTPQTFNGPIVAPMDQAKPSNGSAGKNPSIRKAKSLTPPAQKDGLTEIQATGQAK